MKTKYGNTSIDYEGYHRIHTKENRGKLLHRLIFEDFYGEIPAGYIIHHKDGNRQNNCILNLQLISKKEHDNMHGMEKAKNNSTTRIFRVTKQIDPKFTQGFRWRYCYIKNGKQTCLKSVDLNKLKEKVLEKGLQWIEFEEGKNEVYN